MTLRHFIFCLSVAATYALEFEIKEKTPDNNPYLNTKKLGLMQDAWGTIKNMENETYYLILTSQGRRYEMNLTCFRMRTSGLNHTAKSANLTWRVYNESSQQDVIYNSTVEPKKQKDYKTENVLRTWKIGTSHAGVGLPNGSYDLIDYSEDECKAGSYGDSRRFKSNYRDEYIVFSDRRCYITRSTYLMGICGLWLSETQMNKTMSATTVNKGSKLEARDASFDAEIPESTKKGPIEETFRNLHSSCRFAFLLNCGYPKELMYDKVVCKNLTSFDTA